MSLVRSLLLMFQIQPLTLRLILGGDIDSRDTFCVLHTLLRVLYFLISTLHSQVLGLIPDVTPTFKSSHLNQKAEDHHIRQVLVSVSLYAGRKET